MNFFKYFENLKLILKRKNVNNKILVFSNYFLFIFYFKFIYMFKLPQILFFKYLIHL